MNPNKRLRVSRDRRLLRFQLGDLSEGPLEVAFADRLRYHIEREELKTGDMLPDEQDFAERIGSDQKLVHRVLRTLEAEGRLQGRAGWGWFVA